LRKALRADELELEAATVGDALGLLRGRLDPADSPVQQMFDNAVILVNGRNIRSLSGEDTALGAEDELTVLQQIAGG